MFAPQPASWRRTKRSSRLSGKPQARPYISDSDSSETPSESDSDYETDESPPPRKSSIIDCISEDEAPSSSSYVVPYRRVSHEETIRQINDTILCQELAIEQIGRLLRLLHDSPLRESGGGAVRDRIHKRLLSGPSGVGKSETVRLVQRQLGMAQGEPRARQFIYIDGSEYRDATQINRLVGAGPGYALCDSDATLVADLQRAIDESPVPEVVMLFIDEIDKTHVTFMSVINGLLEDGQIKSSRGQIFTLPLRTQLLVMFTSNYGHEAISALPRQDHYAAVACVERDMREQGLPPNSIERFGSHIIFFPIDVDNMRQVIRKKLCDFLRRRNQLTTRYGQVEASDETQRCIVDFVLATSDPERGIRNAMRHLDELLTELLIDAYFKLQQQQQNGNGALRLFKKAVTCNKLAEQRALSEAIRASVANQRRLAMQSDNAIVHVIGVARGRDDDATVITCMVMPVVERERESIDSADESEEVPSPPPTKKRAPNSPLYGEHSRTKRAKITARCVACGEEKTMEAFERTIKSKQPPFNLVRVRNKSCQTCVNLRHSS